MIMKKLLLIFALAHTSAKSNNPYVFLKKSNTPLRRQHQQTPLQQQWNLFNEEQARANNKEIKKVLTYVLIAAVGTIIGYQCSYTASLEQ